MKSWAVALVVLVVFVCSLDASSKDQQLADDKAQEAPAVCRDTNPRCRAWARHCNNGKYKSWMQKSCCLTCSSGPPAYLADTPLEAQDAKMAIEIENAMTGNK